MHLAKFESVINLKPASSQGVDALAHATHSLALPH
jgi:hypothetical protein